MSRRTRGVGLLLAILTIPAMLSCDPQKEARELFREQGLVLLQPAREYVEPGGMLVIAGRDKTVYIDAFDDVGSSTQGEARAEIPFDHHDSVTLDLALGLIAQEVKIPAGLKIDGAQRVKLEGVDVTVARITALEASHLLSKDATRTFLRSQVAHDRVFLVQEVYKLRSLTLTSAEGNPLLLSHASIGLLPTCSAPREEGNTSGRVHSAEDASTSDDNVSAGSKATTVNSGKPSVSGLPGGGNAISVGACQSGAFSLTLNADRPIPFAVRPSEIVFDADGNPSIRPGNVEHLPQTLGDVVIKGVRKGSSN